VNPNNIAENFQDEDCFRLMDLEHAHKASAAEIEGENDIVDMMLDVIWVPFQHERVPVYERDNFL
jgi:hypothetical protein